MIVSTTIILFSVIFFIKDEVNLKLLQRYVNCIGFLYIHFIKKNNQTITS
jgi:hypothetical protein